MTRDTDGEKQAHVYLVPSADTSFIHDQWRKCWKPSISSATIAESSSVIRRQERESSETGTFGGRGAFSLPFHSPCPFMTTATMLTLIILQ